LADSSLLHIKLETDLKDDIRKLIGMGMFSTEAELAREAIRNLLVDIRDSGDTDG